MGVSPFLADVSVGPVEGISFLTILLGAACVGAAILGTIVVVVLAIVRKR